MEQIVIKVKSDSTSSAIKNFVTQFSDASVEDVIPDNKNYFMENYGINKQEFETRLNEGIAQSVSGITRPWSTIKEELLEKINKK